MDPGRLDVPQSEVPDEHGGPDSVAPDDGGAPESVPATGSDRELTATVPAQLAVISDQLTQLRTMFEAKVSEDERERQWVTQLTSQLAQYRDDFVYKNVISKVFRDLIQLYDTVDETLEPAVLKGISTEDLVARLQNLRQKILRAFDRQGAEPLTSEPRKRFDESRQEAIDVRPVDRSEDNDIVLESVRCGFLYGTRLIRPESVIVGRYEPQDRETDD
jgi:molecular chaperone GrpE (heat shock protein)